MKPNKEYARLRDDGWLDEARKVRAANGRIRILNKPCESSKKRWAVYSLLRNDMNVEDWLAECLPIFKNGNSGLTHLLALYLEAGLIKIR